jgi:hypothetical protein
MNDCGQAAVTSMFAVKFTRGPRTALFLFLGALVLSSCSRRSNQNLFEGNASQEAIRKISEKLRAPVRVLKIEIKPATLSIQVQDSSAPSHVDEYTYRNLPGLVGMFLPAVAGPRAVKLSLINPNLEENLFNLDQLDLNAVPAAAGEAVRRVKLDGGGAVDSITIQRQIQIIPAPGSGDIEWLIGVRGPRESASAYANAKGRITHLDLSGTRRAETLDYTKDSEMLADAIARIRSEFGAKPIYNHFSVSRLNVGFTVRDEKNPNETRNYSCDISAIRYSRLDGVFKMPKNPFEEKREYFSIDDADWSKVPLIRKTALETIVVPNGNVLSLDLSKPSPKLKEQPLRWRVQVVAGSFGESGFALFDPKTGQLAGVELPPSQVKAVDFLDLTKTQEFFANLKEDFDSTGRFLEITILHDSAMVKALPPGKRDEVEKYTYNAKERANPESAPFKSPFDQGFDQKDLFGVADVQGYEARIPDLEKKTIDRLRIPDSKIRNLTFYRRSPFYPGNKKLLLEIWCEGKGDSGRIVYEPSGSEFDIVGGHPSGPVQTTGPKMKSGIFTGEDERFTYPDSAGASDKEVNALFKQWQAVMDADAAAEEKCNVTRWGKLAEKGPVTPADISREDSREYRLAERGRIETAKKCLAFLERPKTKTLMPQLMTTTERHGLDHRKFFDLDFWRATIRRMTASNELKKLSEDHWEEFRRDGFPKEGPDLKPWQRTYLKVEAEEKAAREERHRIIEKYKSGGSN